MADNRQRLAAHARIGQADLDHLAPARDDDEIDRLVHRLQRWCRELIALGDAHDPVMLNFHIVRPTREETVRIWEFYDCMRPDQQGLCNSVEAALGRLNAYLRQPDTRPKRPGRKRGVKLYDDTAAIDAALKLLDEPNSPSRYKAAWEVEPLADRGQSPDANHARIYKALLDL